MGDVCNFGVTTKWPKYWNTNDCCQTNALPSFVCFWWSRHIHIMLSRVDVHNVLKVKQRRYFTLFWVWNRAKKAFVLFVWRFLADLVLNFNLQANYFQDIRKKSVSLGFVWLAQSKVWNWILHLQKTDEDMLHDGLRHWLICRINQTTGERHADFSILSEYFNTGAQFTMSVWI